MEISRRNALVYGLLVAAWLVVLGWQANEHFRVRHTARSDLSYRAKDISTTVGLVLRSQRRFGGVISKERLESALNDLIKPGDINGIAILNPDGHVVASAGTLAEGQWKSVSGPAEQWDKHTVTLMNLVDLGTNVTRDIEGFNPPVVLPREELYGPPPTNPPPLSVRPPPPPMAPTNFTPSLTITGDIPHVGRPRFPRPRWMSEPEYKAALQKQSVHSFLIVLSTHTVAAAIEQDLWRRGIILFFAGMAVAGFGLAWRGLNRSAELQLRLVRASELTAHLKEMNLAAAGLAHETRNPLNIIRGHAQMIAKRAELPSEVREKSLAIVEEVDKVTAQLNEFINYSRPREVRRAPLALSSTLQDLVRALSYDLEEKQARLDITGEPLTVEADEQLLRQALFNLLMNAIQVIDTGGVIQVVTGRMNHAEGFIEIRDNGPGVPVEQRQEIFKPYVTTQPGGTGLGLAVVQQIVLAHGWEIECLPNEPKGAIFRIKHLKLVTKP